MVSVACFGVRVSVMFHLMFIHYTFSSVWVDDGHLLGNIAACSVDHLFCLLPICNIYLFPVLVLRAGFVL